MRGQQNIKFCNAKQAQQIYKYKNIKTKLYKNNSAMWFNKICRMKQIAPGYHPREYVVPDGVLIQTEPPDDEHLLLKTCRGVKIKINTFRKKCIKLVII